MKYTYRPHGVCSSNIEFEMENGIVHSASFTGGCNGNLKGICSLIENMPATEVIAQLEGIRCHTKETSCPDQLSKALREALTQEAQAAASDQT